MYPSQDNLQYLTPGNRYKFLDKNDIILSTDLYRSFTDGFPRNWKLASDVMSYWVGKTVFEFASFVYKTVHSNKYSEYFELIRDINICIKI